MELCSVLRSVRKLFSKGFGFCGRSYTKETAGKRQRGRNKWNLLRSESQCAWFSNAIKINSEIMQIEPLSVSYVLLRNNCEFAIGPHATRGIAFFFSFLLFYILENEEICFVEPSSQDCYLGA